MRKNHNMKPIALITRNVDPGAIDLLTSLCDVLPTMSFNKGARHEIVVPGGCAHAWLVAAPVSIDDEILQYCRKLRVIACAFPIPEHIDVTACTRRGIWLTTVLTNRVGREAELEAARNILDVMSGDIPRGALNEVLQSAV